MREPNAAKLVEALIEAGAALDAPDRLGRSALHLAALAGNAAATRVLLKHGADMSRADARRGATPAHYAAAFARVDAVRLFCAADPGAVRDARDRLGRSPLHWSALSAHRDWAAPGARDVAAALLDAGASPRARDRTGATPAHAAARLGADAFLDHLASRDGEASAEKAPGAEAAGATRPRKLLDECDNRGVSPLDICAARYRLSRTRLRLALDLESWTGLELPEVGVSLSLPRLFGTPGAK